MRFLLIVSLMGLFSGCALDDSINSNGYIPSNKDSMPKNASKPDETQYFDEDSNIVKKTSCLKNEYYTTWKYIVIEYPNNDKDIYCEINWSGNRKLYLSNDHHWAMNSTCIIERAWNQYWIFTIENNSPRVSWYGLKSPEDPTLHSPLTRDFSFTFCKTEEFEDDNWVNRYYYFGENNL